MTFYEVVEQVLALLQREGRVSYRALKREFGVDDDYLEDLKAEIIEAKRFAIDEGGKVLVWTGGSTGKEPENRRIGESEKKEAISSDPRRRTLDARPISYTPQHLAERILAEQTAMEARGAPDGERKTITALFADLKGSTALIENLDPEEARRIIDPALQIMMEAVHRYEGYVAQSLGDGIFALFGAPIAHEDHAHRALYAALRMQEDMRRYADQRRREGGVPISLRVGINTGEVVVRSIRKDDLHTDYVPVGHSTNLAARMENLANPGAVVVSAYTHKLTEGYFEFKALGETQIKGLSEPLPIYEVCGVGPLRTKLQVAARRGLTRFVGRQGEMAQLRRALDQAKAGHGQIVGVMGEPGVGKSRLFYEFKLTSQSGCLVLEAFSVSYGKASPYLPLIELLKTYFQIQPQDDERQRQAKVMGHVLTLDRSLEDILPYLFVLLGLENHNASLQQMDPQIRRRRTFEALKRLFLRESLNQPLILIFEDLHWIDSETQGFLDALSESVAGAKVLLLVNYRPEHRHEWGQKTYYTQLHLAPLGSEEAEELLTSLLGNHTSLQALKQLILERTEGTPFFMEEVVQTLAEEGVLSGERGNYRAEKAPTALSISPTMQGVLAARIDRLSRAEKDLLQQLAVIGREFPLGLVRQVVRQPEEEVYSLLSALQSREFLYEQPAFPEPEYTFKHALTQEVAYGSLLAERRSHLHERIAQAIEALFHSRLEDHYSELAHHYSRSGNTEKAIEYLHLAGQQAVQRSANAEAIRHLTTALELLKTLPDTPERAQQELTLQIALGVPLVATKGYGVLEVEQAYTRALELCHQLGETPQLFPTLLGLSLFYDVRAEYTRARELGEQCLRLAQRVQDPLLLAESHAQLMEILLFCGEVAQARVHAEQGLAFYDPQQHCSSGFLFGMDPGVYCLSDASWVLWLLGYPDQALERSREGLTLAQELAHPFSLGLALHSAAVLYQFRREAQASQERAEAAIALSTEQGFPSWVATGTVLRGWALAAQGRGEEGIVQLRQGLAANQATGEEILRSHFLALLAEAHGKVGQVEDGLAVLAEALTVADKTGERFYEAELYRLKGELLLAQEGSRLQALGYREKTEEAEACFLKAIDIAHQQQAKSLELRATMSLARLWQQQGKKEEAQRMLAEIYGWFTEGFDTKDLQDAKALLEELR